jgi:hypothetical protein
MLRFVVVLMVVVVAAATVVVVLSAVVAGFSETICMIYSTRRELFACRYMWFWW